MAGFDAVTEQRAMAARDVVARFANVAGVFLFGSRVSGTGDRWSDIDVALFVEGVEDWDLHRRARLAAQVQKEAGDEVEPHFFPASALAGSDPAGFAAWVVRHGVEIRL